MAGRCDRERKSWIRLTIASLLLILYAPSSYLYTLDDLHLSRLQSLVAQKANRRDSLHPCGHSAETAQTSLEVSDHQLHTLVSRLTAHQQQRREKANMAAQTPLTKDDSKASSSNGTGSKISKLFNMSKAPIVSTGRGGAGTSIAQARFSCTIASNRIASHRTTSSHTQPARRHPRDRIHAISSNTCLLYTSPSPRD